MMDAWRAPTVGKGSVQGPNSTTMVCAMVQELCLVVIDWLQCIGGPWQGGQLEGLWDGRWEWEQGRVLVRPSVAAWGGLSEGDAGGVEGGVGGDDARQSCV